MTDRIEMLNRALLRIGANPLIDELDPSAAQHLAVYDSVLERMGSHPFSFFRTTIQLAKVDPALAGLDPTLPPTMPPAAFGGRYASQPGWPAFGGSMYRFSHRNAYQLPTDRIAAPRALYGDNDMRQPFTDYDIEGDFLLTDREQVWCAYQRRTNPARWPGDFRECFTIAVMAELALSVREDRPLHDRLFAKAFGTPGQGGIGGLFATAMENDSQAQPSTIAGGGVNPLIDVRF
jgi:hypothetical protein